MINYRLSAAVSGYYVMQTLVQTHINFVDAALLIFFPHPVSFQFLPERHKHVIILHYLESPV